VRLDGVLEHPEGVWASRIINYTLGYNGIEASINNALGPDTQLGPYQDRIATCLGDQLSDMILGFCPLARPAITRPQFEFGTKLYPCVFYISQEESFGCGNFVTFFTVNAFI